MTSDMEMRIEGGSGDGVGVLCSSVERCSMISDPETQFKVRSGALLTFAEKRLLWLSKMGTKLLEEQFWIDEVDGKVCWT